ncbi:NAD(P)H-hydrate epimerase [Micromonospora sp. M12]
MLAVDVPSGVAVDTGHVPLSASGRPSAVRADVTVAFGALKPALVVGPAAALAGQVELVDIGLRPWLRGSPALRVTEWSDLVDWWPQLGPASEKYTRGVVGCRPARRRTRVRRCSPWVVLWPGRPAWSATPAAPAPRCCTSTPR